MVSHGFAEWKNRRYGGVNPPSRKCPLVSPRPSLPSLHSLPIPILPFPAPFPYPFPALVEKFTTQLFYTQSIPIYNPKTLSLTRRWWSWPEGWLRLIERKAPPSPGPEPLNMARGPGTGARKLSQRVRAELSFVAICSIYFVATSKLVAVIGFAAWASWRSNILALEWRRSFLPWLLWWWKSARSCGLHWTIAPWLLVSSWLTSQQRY